MRILITIIACLALATGALAAERNVTVTPVDGVLNSIDLAAPSGVCVMGNTNAPAWASGEFIWGAESYAIVFEAQRPPCGCPAGFSVEQIHSVVQFPGPVTFGVYVTFHETEYDASADCMVPGAEICSSALYTVTIPSAGMYDIALPIDPTTCACTYFGYKYAASMTFVDAFDEYPDLISDNFPVGCTSYVDYGGGWLDLIDFGVPGEIIINADIVCCENPVPNEDRSWGELKSLFR
ncbi:hypothetical protein DRQ50_09650 [bacterium]|nr:MAG: hypothetical protein DRQ50_09650 [bacterium]